MKPETPKAIMMRKKRMNWMILAAIGIVLIFIVLVQAYRMFGSGPSISQARLLELMKQPSAVCILDVRSTKEYQSGIPFLSGRF